MTETMEPKVVNMLLSSAIKHDALLADDQAVGVCRIAGKLVTMKNEHTGRTRALRGNHDYALVQDNAYLPLLAEQDVHVHLEQQVEPGATITVEGMLWQQSDNTVSLELWSWEPALAWVTETGKRRVQRNQAREEREATQYLAEEQLRLQQRLAAYDRGEVDRQGREPEATAAWAERVREILAGGDDEREDG